MSAAADIRVNHPYVESIEDPVQRLIHGGLSCKVCNLPRYHHRDREILDALKTLREACTPAYKAGRIPAEPFVRAGNVIADANTDATRMRTAMVQAARELRGLHFTAHPTCKDQGPNSCPTWEAIHALEAYTRAATDERFNILMDVDDRACTSCGEPFTAAEAKAIAEGTAWWISSQTVDNPSCDGTTVEMADIRCPMCWWEGQR